MSRKGNTRIDGGRREVIKSTGAVAGLNLLNIVPQRDPNASKFKFVEASYEYDIASSSVTIANLPILHMDFAPDYHLGKGALVTNPYAETPDNTFDLFRNQNIVIRGNDYHTTPAKLFATETAGLPYGVEPDLRKTYRLNLTESVAQPELEIQQSDEDVLVIGDSINEKVSPNEEISRQLDTMDVQVELTRIVDKPVSNEEIPEFRRPLQTESWKETISVVPEITVRNNGQILLYRGETH